MVSDASIQVLAERVSAAMDDLKEMKGKVDAMHLISTRLAGVEKDVIAVDRKVEVALSKSDAMDNLFMTLKEDVIAPIKEDIALNKSEIANNRKWWRTVGAIAFAIPALTAWAGLTWKPWQSDFDAAKAKRDEQMAKYSQDVGKELQNDDRRISVLEFRIGSVEESKPKGSK